MGKNLNLIALKENKENLEKDIKNVISEINSLNNKNKDDQLVLSNLNKDLNKLKKSNDHFQSQIEEKKDIRDMEEKKNLLIKEIKSYLEKIEMLSLQQTETQTEIKTLTEITGNNLLSDKSVVNLLKIKKL